jgi:putative NADPH-quinone reductase
MSGAHTGDNSARIVIVFASARAAGLGQRLLECARAELLRAGARVRVHDLLREGFDPVLRLAPGQPYALACPAAEDALTARYQEDARWADSFVILHPVWWFAPPALLMGWVDRVLVHDVALWQREGAAPLGLFGGKRMLVIQTFNAKRAIDRLAFLGISGFFWKRVVAASVGIERVSRLALYSVEGLEAARLERFEMRLRRALQLLVP